MRFGVGRGPGRDGANPITPFPRYSEEVRGLISKMLTLDPEARPDIDAVLNQLEVLNPS